MGTSVLDPARLPDEELIRTYKGQGGVERGFRFLKDPLFLASSVFVKKPERIVALGFVMVVCLLVYRLAEHRLRKRLAEGGESIPNQAGKPSDKPTMRCGCSSSSRASTCSTCAHQPGSSTGTYFTSGRYMSKYSACSVQLTKNSMMCPYLKLRNVG